VAGSLVDSSVWLAAVFPQHPHHVRAQEELSIATPLAPAVFCRATQQSFLRLITTPQILRAYAVEAMTNRSAWKTFELLRAHSSIVVHDEPPGTVALWHRLAAGDTASPKVWMDAYLAAFAISGGLSVVTLDRDFKRYEAHGLGLRLLVTADAF
jgi:toxin-antitoxin system PIN domain toxin